MVETARRRNLTLLAMCVAAALLFAAACGLGRGLARNDAAGQARDGAAASATERRETLHPILVNRPDGPPRVATGVLDDLGRPVTVSCASCHANLEPNPAARSGAQLVEFHRGLNFDHGDMTCLTCHNANNYNALRLADGRDLPFESVQTMCAQCHAPQHRDFLRGAHGGMSGYWDRARGPQHRKNCIDCHDPHSPAFPHMIPTFKPRDRFLAPPGEHH